MPIHGSLGVMDQDLPSTEHQPFRPALLVGALSLGGVSTALMAIAGLGLAPWSVLAQGMAERLPISFGLATAVIAAAVMLAASTRRAGARPGIGWSVGGLAVLAATIDVTMAITTEPGLRDIEVRCALLVAGVLGTGVAAALAIAAGERRAPDQRLWVGLAERTGITPLQVRTAIELAVTAVGMALGGLVNFGTVFAVVITGAITRAALVWIDRGADRALVVQRRRAAERARTAERRRAALAAAQAPARGSVDGLQDLDDGIRVRLGVDEGQAQDGLAMPLRRDAEHHAVVSHAS